ncbi:HAMP domain-containing protein [Rhodocyclus tenuis]|uniref:methyl-accepting chemotaxis protein n=1 Tax=Rhodocyclus gracilis TaxID=2929842 RepID=UPI0012989394|nr:methyl-accepting chemotaxis protein [Rhodocyclus gracilis]MRD74168.1 HAMP domain-containing protein [Rhodocyclus gracilis]
MSITQRLVLTLLLALAALVGVGSGGLWQLYSAQQRVEYVETNIMPSLTVLDDAMLTFASLRVAAYQHALVSDHDGKHRLEAEIAASEKSIKESLDHYERDLISDDEDRKLLGDDRAAVLAYSDLMATALERSNSGDIEGARTILTTALRATSRVVNGALKAHVDYNHQLSDAVKAEGLAAYNRSLQIIGATIALSLLLVSVLGGLLYRSIRNSLSGIESTLISVSSTLDFTQTAPVLRDDEVGRTAKAFNALLTTLRGGLGEISGCAGEVANASRELTSTAQQVAHAAAAQSEASSSVAASVQQMTVSINHVAERTRDAQSLAATSSELALSSSKTIGETIDDIREISSVVRSAASSIRDLETQSTAIGSVVQVIREVAEQTNLLALNAAIEAARAGEQGRGFAVVADEVRKLAERTAASTQEIAGTIEAMRVGSHHAAEQVLAVEARVNDSVTRADNADQAIRRIGEAASQTTATVNEIADSIREQGLASNSIAGQIERIAQMSEESSAAAEETAAAAGSLDEQAAKQQSVLGRYKL